MCLGIWSISWHLSISWDLWCREPRVGTFFLLISNLMHKPHSNYQTLWDYWVILFTYFWFFVPRWRKCGLSVVFKHTLFLIKVKKRGHKWCLALFLFQELKKSLLFVYPLNLVIMPRACAGDHNSNPESLISLSFFKKFHPKIL